MHAAEDKDLLDMAQTEAFQRPVKKRDRAERQQYTGLVLTEYFETAVVAVCEDDRLQRSFVNIVSFLRLVRRLEMILSPLPAVPLPLSAEASLAALL